MTGVLGPPLANIVTLHDFNLLCLTEIHVHLSNTDSFLGSITPDCVSLQKCHPSGIGSGVSFCIRCSYRPHKIECAVHWSFENMVVSTVLHSRTLFLAWFYDPQDHVPVIF